MSVLTFGDYNAWSRAVPSAATVFHWTDSDGFKSLYSYGNFSLNLSVTSRPSTYTIDYPKSIAVNSSVSSTAEKVQLSDISQLLGPASANLEFLNFSAAITSPVVPAYKPLLTYVIPAGKVLNIYGYAMRMASATTYFRCSIRKTLWKFANAIANPAAAPTLAQKTVTGAGLTTLSIYRYKYVAVNNVGKTTASTSATALLTGTNNTITLTLTIIAGAAYYEIYRTLANGGVGTEKFLAATPALTFVDTIPDTQVGTLAPPGSNTTGGSVNGVALPINFVSGQVVIDVIAAITAATTLDIIYLNAFGAQRYTTATSGTLAGTQTEVIGWQGDADVTGDIRILRATGGQEYIDMGINDIINIGNTPATGGFNVDGILPIFEDTSTALTWKYVTFPTIIQVTAGDELVISTAANVAVTIAARNDLIIFGGIVNG